MNSNRLSSNRPPQPESPANSLLAELPRKAYLALLPGMSPVTLAFGDILYEPGGVMRDVYFPGRSMVSLLTVVDRRAALEVGLVGREGMVGLPLALGVNVSSVRALVQGEGAALRMSASRLRGALRESPALQRSLNRYACELMAQVSRTAACNRFHGVEARLARWLLMTRDRACSERFHLTHEFLSHMLGVRRVGVTLAASALYARGLIEYSRGNIRILDSARLERTACSCYEAARIRPPVAERAILSVRSRTEGSSMHPCPSSRPRGRRPRAQPPPGRRPKA